jgi:hypothetical protein
MWVLYILAGWLVCIGSVQIIAFSMQAARLRQVVETLTQATKRQLRAYVSARVDYIYNFSPTVAAEMRCIVANHGQTPAYNVATSGRIEVLPYPLPEEHVLPDLPAFHLATDALQPGQSLEVRIRAGRLFTQSEIDRAASDDGCRFYCFGKVQYTDAFAAPRKTEFCQSVAGSPEVAAIGSGGTEMPVHVTFQAAGRHNRSDD